MNERIAAEDTGTAWLARHATALAFAAVAISALCKLARLHSRELWLDETYSALVAAKPFGALLRDTFGDLHPPLYHMLLWGWERIFGDMEAVLRLFSVLLNIGSMFAEFFLARRILGKVYGAYATVLYAFSPMLFIYSMEVRSYMLLILLTILIVWMHWRTVVESEGSVPNIVLYAVFGAALFYVHYLSVFVLLALLLHGCLLTARRKQGWARLGVVVVLVATLSVPGVFLLAAQHHNASLILQSNNAANQRIDSLSYGGLGKMPSDAGRARAFWTKSVAAAAGVYPGRPAPLLLLSAISVAVLCAGLVLFALKGEDELLLLFFAVTFSLGVGILLLHTYSTRYLLLLVPLLALGFARVLQRWNDGKRAVWVATAVGLLVLLSYGGGFARQVMRPHGRPWTDLVATLKQVYRPGDEVIFSAPYAQVPFDYYARHASFAPQETGFPISIYTWWKNQREVQGWGSPIVMRADLDRFADQLQARPSKRVWVVLYEDGYYDPHSRLQARLRSLGDLAPVHLAADAAEFADEASALRLYLFTYP